MNKTKSKQKIRHIEEIHSRFYNISDLREFRATRKSLIRTHKKNIKELQTNLRLLKNNLVQYSKEFKAYDKIIKQKEQNRLQSSKSVVGKT